MKRFFRKISILAIVLVAVNLFFLFAIPKDNNAYLCEYAHKMQLLSDTTSQPRVIMIGGSNIAFGIDSKEIGDSLRCRIINLGLHAGIGIRYPLEDCLKYIRNGDVVVLQFEYENFFGGDNGEPETFPAFMVATDWRNLSQLNVYQWKNILAGMPSEAVVSMKRLVGFLLRGSFDSPVVNEKFTYVKSGFNEYGDEVSHISYPNAQYVSSGKPNTRQVNRGFIDWLAETIGQYEQAGAKVVLLPPVCIESHLRVSYNDHIEKALARLNHPYLVRPDSMALNDSCMFDKVYHMNEEGIRQNTRTIIKSLAL